jgi:rSAM/selenodomain-associated transferase 2/rSAM/selenodomain-associated transferase 1
MIEQTVKRARSLSSKKKIDIEIRYSGGNWRKMRRWLGPGLTFRPQCPGDLGQRMEAAFHGAFDSGSQRVVLIGTDVPGCSMELLEQAFHALPNHDLVLGPAKDGGYWLIGLRKYAKIFGNIAWSTDAVLGQTLKRASQLQLSTHLLSTLSDVDCPADLSLLEPTLQPDSPLISVIIPALNEAANIEVAIRSAQTDSVEIIVVDGGSSDDTVKRAQALGVRLIVSSPGRARQMNSGARLAKGKWLVFLHADSVLPQGYAANIFETFFDQRTVAGAFSLKSDAPSVALSMINWLVHVRTKYFQMPYGDQAIFVRQSVFQTLGGFPDVPVAEDLLFVQRLKRLGRIAAIPAAVITSARRWHRVGLLRALLINQIIVAGYCLSIPPGLLARLYKIGYAEQLKLKTHIKR